MTATEEEERRLSPETASRYARMAALLAVLQLAVFATLFFVFSAT